MSQECSYAAPRKQNENPEVAKIIDRYKGQRGSLLPILHAVQEELGFLTNEVLCQIAESLDIPLSEVYGTASFYTLFNLKPKGKHIIRVCDSSGCYTNDAASVLKTLMDTLRIKPGETTADGKFTLEFTSCLGVCNQSPAMMVDDEIFGNLTAAKVKEIIGSYK